MEAEDVDVGELHGLVVRGFETRLGAVESEQWGRATPCTEWDVRGLVEHVTGNHLRLASVLHGRPIENGGADTVSAWSAARDQVRSGLAVPGALESRAPSPFGGEASGRDLAHILAADLAMHTWDLARAIGADDTLDADVVAFLLPVFERIAPGLAASGKFGPRVAVPESAGPQRLLLALTGRDEAWSPLG
ncbi:TIGR03086 family metal-binding protein [Nocardia sp. CDC153]|uniref:TIGR03086 family metal-binding protein n=1 Tax=Nocardia sp. CDC153 TaxID=3112167 RepID=UPI002DB9836A|nr:TIGR03086 family metal-binding protein [Nocardia sp. CDC153]MEC3954535.1 TIGR03086 family metal-binding protein [Nocardia sp. CDC153]